MWRRTSWLTLIVAVIAAAPVGAADDAAEQAVWLLKKATLVHPNSFHNVLLRALRQLRDPQLEPLFSELVTRQHPEMKLHGILALAEISPAKKLDLALVADLKDPAIQAQVVSAAIDGKLLTNDEARQLMGWPGLDDSVRVIVAAKLVSDGEKVDPQGLKDATTSENLALRGMAAMIQMQLGDDSGQKILDEVAASDAPGADRVAGLLLQTAERYEFSAVGPWAMDLANKEQADDAVRYMALRVALVSQVKSAINAWLHRFDTADGAVARIRLSLLALDLADKIDPRAFDPMLQDDVELIRLIGKTGKAIAAKSGIDQAIAELLAQNHMLVARWAYAWAGEQDERTARPTLVAIVRAADSGPDRFRAQRLELAVLAAQKLFENGGDSRKQLQGLLQTMGPMTQEAMLMGLIRSHEAGAYKAISGIDKWQDKSAAAMALLLRAKHGEKLSDDQMQDLALIVRGGAGLQDPLRAQAAWSYLKLTGQDRVGLATVLGR